MNSISKEKAAIILAILYTAIIGVGMYVSFHIFGYKYSSPNLHKVLWLVEIILTSLTLFFAKRFFSFKELGFGKLDKKNLFWLAIPAIVIIITWFQFFGQAKWAEVNWGLWALVAFTTALVGFSEELTYRGIVLHSFLQKRPLWLAMLISALLFSLLHSVNIFAGKTPSEVLPQLIFTFVFGMFMAPLALKLKTLWPLIIFHWQWDFMLMGNSMVIKINPLLPAISNLAIIVMTVALWLMALRKEKIVK